MFLFNLIFRGFNVRGHRDFQTDPITDDVKLVHKALLKESHRLGRNKVISLTIFMGHTDLDFTGIDIYAALAVCWRTFFRICSPKNILEEPWPRRLNRTRLWLGCSD